jgi:hypothetical protein
MFQREIVIPAYAGMTAYFFAGATTYFEVFARCQELHDSIEQPGRSRAQSGRFSAKRSLPGCSS